MNISQLFVHFFGLTEPNQLLLPFTITFCVAILLAGSLRLLSLWVNTRLTYAVGQ